MGVEFMKIAKNNKLNQKIPFPPQIYSVHYLSIYKPHPLAQEKWTLKIVDFPGK